MTEHLRHAERRRMTAEELRAALDDLDLSDDDFCWLTGYDPRRLRRVLKGEDSIAPWVPQWCALATLPGALELAKKVARAYGAAAPRPRPEDRAVLSVEV